MATSAMVCTAVGLSPPRLTNAPLDHSSASGSASIAAPASSLALARIFSAVPAMAADVPPEGLVLKLCPSPNRSVSAGTTLTSSAGTPSSSATSRA